MNQLTTIDQKPAADLLASGASERSRLHGLVEIAGWQDHTLRRALTGDERRFLAANAKACEALLTPADRSEAAAQISAMLIAFGARPGEAEAAVLVNAYLEAIGNAPLWAIDRARANFLAGRVEKQSKTFAPKPPEFVAELDRLLFQVRLAKHQIDAIRIAKQPLAAGRKVPFDWKAICGIKSQDPTAERRWDETPPVPDKSPVRISRVLASALSQPAIVGDAYQRPGELEAALRKVQTA